jgi:hypothetical protein
MRQAKATRKPQAVDGLENALVATRAMKRGRRLKLAGPLTAERGWLERNNRIGRAAGELLKLSRNNTWWIHGLGQRASEGRAFGSRAGVCQKHHPPMLSRRRCEAESSRQSRRRRLGVYWLCCFASNQTLSTNTQKYFCAMAWGWQAGGLAGWQYDHDDYNYDCIQPTSDQALPLPLVHFALTRRCSMCDPAFGHRTQR